ncbi:MAG: hypothetical protein HRU08_06860 [Oleispira sp.]|nr:hypothetical protein [Oleispira sp.]
MRPSYTQSALLALLLSTTCASQADFQLDLGFASEYVRDGIKQSKAKPVLQFGGLYASQQGIYGGAWASSIERGSPDSTRFELDGFAGWYIPLATFMAIDLSFTRSTFLGDAKANKQAYNEGSLNLLFNNETTLGYSHANDYMGSGQALQTLELAHTINSGEFGFEFSTRQYRYLTTTNDINWGSKSRDDYFHFRAGVARSYFEHDMSLAIEKTNLSSQFDASTQIIFTYNRKFQF